jgi:hypothetical protein
VFHGDVGKLGCILMDMVRFPGEGSLLMSVTLREIMRKGEFSTSLDPDFDLSRMTNTWHMIPLLNLCSL